VPARIRRRRLLLSIANHSVAIALSIAFLLPFVFILATSLMTNQQALSPDIWPHPFVWSNYKTVFESFPFVRYTLNTVTYAGLATSGCCSPASRWPTPCRGCSGGAARPPSCWSSPP
jgi:multiple sugar transport system permease protein